MINLLPPLVKQQYLYGRRNTSLRRWAAAFLVGLLGVALVTSFGYFYLQKSISNYQGHIAQTQAKLDEQKLTEVQKHSEDITNSLKLVVKVLGKEILFSQLLKQIGAVTPPGAALTDLRYQQNRRCHRNHRDCQ